MSAFARPRSWLPKTFQASRGFTAICVGLSPRRELYLNSQEDEALLKSELK